MGGNAGWVLGTGERSSGSLIASAKAGLTPATRSGGSWLSINTCYTVIVPLWISTQVCLLCSGFDSRHCYTIICSFSCLWLNITLVTFVLKSLSNTHNLYSLVFYSGTQSIVLFISDIVSLLCLVGKTFTFLILFESMS